MLHQHTCDVHTDDYATLEKNMDWLMKISEVKNCIVTLSDLNKKKYLIESDRYKRVLGYDKNPTGNEVNLEDFYKQIHPTDLPFVLDSQIQFYNFLQQLPPQEKKGYKLVYIFRIKNKDDIYLRFINQVTILELDKHGDIWQLLIVSDMLSKHVYETMPQRYVINMKTGKYHLFKKELENNPTQLFTKREKEVVSLIAQGLDSVAIANKLFISVNTVNNHRRNILSKTKTGNTPQALLYAKYLGII